MTSTGHHDEVGLRQPHRQFLSDQSAQKRCMLAAQQHDGEAEPANIVKPAGFVGQRVKIQLIRGMAWKCGGVDALSGTNLGSHHG